MKGYNLLMNWKSQYIKKSMFYKMIKRSQCNLRKIPEGNYSGNVHVDFKKSKHESSNPDNTEKNKAGSLELWPSMIPLPSHAPFALAPLPHVACGILVLQPRTRDLTWGHSTEDAES